MLVKYINLVICIYIYIFGVKLASLLSKVLVNTE